MDNRRDCFVSDKIACKENGLILKLPLKLLLENQKKKGKRYVSDAQMFLFDY